MKIHKRTLLTLTDREELWKLHCTRKHSQSELVEIFRVSRQTISKILQRCRGREFVPRSSINKRFRSLQYGLKRLKKVEFEIEKRKSQRRRDTINPILESLFTSILKGFHSSRKKTNSLLENISLLPLMTSLVSFTPQYFPTKHNSLLLTF